MGEKRRERRRQAVEKRRLQNRLPVCPECGAELVVSPSGFTLCSLRPFDHAAQPERQGGAIRGPWVRTKMPAAEFTKALTKLNEGFDQQAHA